MSSRVRGRAKLDVSLGSWDDARAAALGFVFITVLAADNGGYSATTWGWSALALLWVAALALVLRKDIRLRPIELALPGGLLALFGWILLSNLWTSSRTDTMLESERLLVYIAGSLAAILTVRSQSYRALLGGVWAAIALVCGYGLLTRLFPERLGHFDPISGYRLSEPVGYWNALGLLAALGTLLAVGLAARARPSLVRFLAAVSLAVTLPTLYFTFSRGAWIALAGGMLAALAVDPRRLQLTMALLWVGAWPAVGVWLASRSPALTHVGAAVAPASREGHRLAVELAALAIGAGGAALVYAALERRVHVSTLVRRAYAVFVALLCLAALAGLFARYGPPAAMARKVHQSLTATPPATSGNLNRRLFNLSSVARVRQWRVAWEDYKDHQLLGSGPGTYEQAWLQNRPDRTKVIDAHSLYLESLSEMGPVGLALLVIALALPLVAAVRARASPLAPAAFGAYVAYLLHAGVDWDWELTGVTSAALFCGCALLVAGRKGKRPGRLPHAARRGVLAATSALACLALAGLAGNAALSSADRAASADRPDRAEAQARKASRWAPWSSQPWRQLASAHLAQREQASARKSMTTAIAKDPGNWRLWYELSLMTTGLARAKALDQAIRLNPLQPELVQLRAALSTH